MSTMHTGGGRFDPREKNIYFLAADTSRHIDAHGMHSHLLIALNFLRSNETIQAFEDLVTHPQNKVFLDSGIFDLVMRYVRKEKARVKDAFLVNPSDIQGFGALFDLYVSIVKKYEQHLWGYCEIDLGGQENKKRTRAKLEALGLRPIPVFHPLNDEPEYFNELAGTYDRVCIGGIARASNQDRLRILATISEKRRHYPNIWIHVLGFSPNYWLHAYPMNSCDSTTWLNPVKWPRFPLWVDGNLLGDLPEGYIYIPGERDTLRGSNKAIQLSGYIRHLDMLGWRRHYDLMYGDFIE